MIASNRASSSENDVSIRHWISGCRDRISRQTSTPSPSASRTSSSATSGRVGGMRDSASSAVAASPTTSMSPPGLEQVREAAADDVVVVEQEHPYHAVHCPSDHEGSDAVHADRPARPTVTRRDQRHRLGPQPTDRAAADRRVGRASSSVPATPRSASSVRTDASSSSSPSASIRRRTPRSAISPRATGSSAC